MLNISSKIIELRKAKGWSQTDLAKAVDASRDIIGKYERGDNTPSLDMSIKLAQVFDVSLDFLTGIGKNASFDKAMLQRFEDIEGLDNDTKNTLFTIIDTFLRDAKARKAYS
ncbi:MAG: XRE family transcriptional regulator [Chryseobacterium sp.]|nr:XRE family transcriptional regulator [Chryseobacterium sp.]